MTPSKNGGSGAMPSGYATLYFELADGDWVDELTLPEHPRNGDKVILSSRAADSARLMTEATSLQDMRYLPIESLSQIQLVWSNELRRWNVQSSDSSRIYRVVNQATSVVPTSSHWVTSVYHHPYVFAPKVTLPAWAPAGALVVFTNFQLHDVQMAGAANGVICGENQTCAYVFNSSDARWYRRAGERQVRAAVELPAPTARWTHVHVGAAWEDLETPGYMSLPSEGIDGDIYQITNPSRDHFARIGTVNTSLADEVFVSEGVHTFRYEAAARRWVHQAK